MSVMDVHSPETRRFNMSRIKSKNTRPELVIRRWLWANGRASPAHKCTDIDCIEGTRYRLHRRDLGRPDITLAKYEAVLFVHGCFWHRHGCKLTTTPSSRRAFWIAKFDQNVERDKYNIEALTKEGWRVMIIWECSIRGSASNLELVGRQILTFLTSDIGFAESSSAK